MGQDRSNLMVDFVSELVHQRIEKRGISLEDISYCLTAASETYQDGLNTVYRCILSNGRYLKVAMRDGLVIRAFYHQ